MNKKELLESLKDVYEVNIETRPKDPSKSTDGGDYYFNAVYRRVSRFIFEVNYSTSASFNFCNIYGGFQDCENCSEYHEEYEGAVGKFCQADPEKVSLAKLAYLVEQAGQDENKVVLMG